jgi:hypothetical protein
MHHLGFHCLRARSSHIVNDKTDVVGAKTFAYCGQKMLEDVPRSSHCYLEASKASEGWSKRIGGVVDRVLVTAGAQRLRDDIELFYRKVQKNGAHNDPYYDLLLGEKICLT